MQKVITYIDGFNLYFGLKEKGWKRYYWLNLFRLATNLLKPCQSLHRVKYFTSRISLPPDKAQRQTTYIEALETIPELKVFYGKYQTNSLTCNKCGHVMMRPNEKMTDVNIAVEMLADAFLNSFDVAILISADSDLIGTIKHIRKLFPEKQIVIAFPPSRFSFELQNAANASFTIGRKKLKDSLFPDEIIKKDGHVLHRPSKWNHSDTK
ncbi:MAG: NYN domain-containing protein [Bacteroidetes bacterium]|nr:NYN domain-containing protein [Bacteroidota bacterium]